MIPPETRRNPDKLSQANRLVGFSLAMLFWVPVFAILYFLLGDSLAGEVILTGGVMVQANLLLLRRGRDAEYCGNFLTASAWFVYSGLALVSGGPYSPVMPWYATLPILSVLLAGSRSGYWWTATTIGTVATLKLASEWGLPFEVVVSPEGMQLLHFTGLIGLVLCIFLLVN